MSGKISDNLGTASGLVKSATDAPDSGSSDPTVSTNPSAVGDRFINTTSGELFVATTVTAGENVWKGQLGTTVQPPQYYGARGVWAGGYTGADPYWINVMQYVTISSLGNSSDFGDLTELRSSGGGNSNGTRGVLGGGQKAGWASTNVIDYWTFSSLGNATDFGDMSVTRQNMSGVCGDGTKGVWAGGNGNSNVIDYVNIASTGNATDFGNLTVGRLDPGGTSNGTRGVFGGGQAA